MPNILLIFEKLIFWKKKKLHNPNKTDEKKTNSGLIKKNIKTIFAKNRKNPNFNLNCARSMAKPLVSKALFIEFKGTSIQKKKIMNKYSNGTRLKKYII